MDKKYLYVLIVLFFSIDLYMLYRYQALKERVNREDFLLAYRAQSYLSNSFAVVSDNLFDEHISEEITRHFSGSPDSQLNIVYLFFMSNRDCSSCITDTLERLEELDKDTGRKMLIFYEHTLPSGLKFNHFFEFQSIDYARVEAGFSNYFTDHGINQFPILLIYDLKQHRVIDAYQPEPNNPLFLDAFSRRLSYLNIQD